MTAMDIYLSVCKKKSKSPDSVLWQKPLYESELKKLDLRSGFQRHRHIVGFFLTCTSDRRREANLLRLFQETAYFSSFYDAHGDTEDLQIKKNNNINFKFSCKVTSIYDVIAFNSTNEKNIQHGSIHMVYTCTHAWSHCRGGGGGLERQLNIFVFV